jgi:chorismate dehydratase
MIKIGAVSYINTKPLLYGLQQYAAINNNINIVQHYPAQLAQMLIHNSVDIALVPVGILPQLPAYFFVGNYGIASEGKVASVAIFSKVPLQQVTHILLDYQSKTSVLLTKIVLKYYFKQHIQFVETTTHFENNIDHNTAALVIGDRALTMLNQYPYVYDSSLIWQQFTQLPFVFARWISTKPIDPHFIEQFDAAQAFGLSQIENIVKTLHHSTYSLQHYFTQNIKYRITTNMEDAMLLFLQYVRTMQAAV